MKNSLSKTKIKKHARMKTNPEIKETIALALKNKEWNSLAKSIAYSTRKYLSLNLFQIDKQTSAGDSVIIPGKILSKGELTKKIKICALAISENAKEKLKDTKSEFVSILNEIKKNPKMEGVKILR